MRTSPATLSLGGQILLVVAFLGLLVGLTYANYQFALAAPGGNDFLARWMGARMWLTEGISPYDPRVALATQEVFYGRPADPSQGEDLAYFVYPLPAMIFFAPFGLLPYTLARAVWMTLLEVGLPLLALMGARLTHWRPPPLGLAALMLFSVVWYHGFRAIILGQFAVVEALLLTGALLAVQREQDALAGVLMALSVAKPQMAYMLVPFVLIWGLSRRRFALLGWTLGAGAALLVASLLLLPGWPIDWLRQVLAYPGYTPPGSPVAILTGYVPGIGRPLAFVLGGLLFLYLIWEWMLAWGKEDPWFQWTAALTVVISQFILVRTATTNYVLFLPGLVLIFRMWTLRWRNQGWRLAGLVMVLLTVGPWALFLATVEGNQEATIMHVPLPILMLFGLWWVRWWAIRASRLPLEGPTVPTTVRG